jgi:hypothetical protein
MSWYKVTLPMKECGITGKGKELQDAFGTLVIANAAPIDAAMFSQQSKDFESVFYYFSPGAIRIAGTLIESYNPVACEAPLQGTVSLAVGDARALYILLRRADQNN